VQPSILIVDDEQLICWSLSEQLAREGYRIVQAETAAQATDRARDGIVRGELGKIRIATQDAPHNALANGAVAQPLLARKSSPSWDQLFIRSQRLIVACSRGPHSRSKGCGWSSTP
jgi:CheY-like chemotaxis protein